MCLTDDFKCCLLYRGATDGRAGDGRVVSAPTIVEVRVSGWWRTRHNRATRVMCPTIIATYLHISNYVEVVKIPLLIGFFVQ